MDYKRVECRGKTLSLHIDETLQVVVRAPRWVPKAEVEGAETSRKRSLRKNV